MSKLATQVAALVIALMTGAQSQASAQDRIAPIAFTRPAAEVRGQDSAGCGRFDCGRGSRRHNAVDYIAQPGQPIRAPISGVIERTGRAYRDDDRFTLVVIDGGDGFVVKLMYVAPGVEIGQRVAMGEVIGQAQDIREHYPDQPNMIPHIHVELYYRGERIDPETTTLILRQF